MRILKLLSDKTITTPLDLGDDKNSPCSVRLPIGWVISGPLPPSVNSTSSCFKSVVEDSSLTDQIKSWYELESHGAFKQVDARSAADKHALSILNSETVHNGERYIVPMLWIDSNVSLPNIYYSSLAQFKTLERRLSKDPELRERYAETIKEDIRKSYVVTVEPHDPHKHSDREWYLPHHPVVNPNKPGKVSRVLNGASKFHVTSLKKSLMVGRDLLQNLIFVLLRFPQHKYAVSADLEGMFLQVGVLARDQISLRFFCGGRIPLPMWQFISTLAIYSAHGIRLRAPVSRCEKQQLIICPHTLRPPQS